MRGKDGNTPSVTQQQELPRGSGAQEAPQGRGAGALRQQQLTPPVCRSPPAARAPSPAPQRAGSDLQPRLMPPRDSRAKSCRPLGSSKAAIKHPGDLTASANNSGCRLRLDGSRLYPARHPRDKPRQPLSPSRPVCLTAALIQET